MTQGVPPDGDLPVSGADVLRRLDNSAEFGSPVLTRGRYHARLARTPEDLQAAQALRGAVFRGGLGLDQDSFDDSCAHMLIEDSKTGLLLCCYRFAAFPVGADLAARSYAAQYYELSALGDFGGPILEIGRFCVLPGCPDPDVLRLAWGALTRLVDAQGVTLLCGCASFSGTDPHAYLQAFALLRARYLAPVRWRPTRKAPEVYGFGSEPLQAVVPRSAMAEMPALLRTYLSMGGWVSDHAVIDHEMRTMHVFTGVEIAGIPPARQRLLRAVAG